MRYSVLPDSYLLRALGGPEEILVCRLLRLDDVLRWLI